MNRILMTLFQRIALWRALGRNKKLYEFGGDGMGGFRARFYRHYLEIDTIGGNFGCRLMVGSHPYGYLLASARQGKIENIHGYCMYMYSVAMSLTTDKGLADDISRVLKKYDARLAKRADSAREDGAFADDMALKEVRSNEERGAMTRAQRRKAERKARKDMKDGLKYMTEAESRETEKE